MSNTVLVLTNGTKHYINDKQISEAFRELIDAGYTPLDASEHALSLIIGRLEADALSTSDFIYGRSDFQTELTFLSQFNSRTQLLTA